MQMGVVGHLPLIDAFYRYLFEVTGVVLAFIAIVIFVNLTKRFMRWEIAVSTTARFPDRSGGLSAKTAAQFDNEAIGDGTRKSVSSPLIARLILRRGIAVLWIFDALLQAQPQMVTQRFVTGVLKMVQQDQPMWLYHLMERGILVWAHHPIAANIAAIYIQLGVGSALLFADPDTRMGKLGLWTSILWAVFIWVFGEGLGGILTGSATYLAGSPGSAFFYAAAAALLLLPKRYWLSGKNAWLGRIGIGCYWLVSAVWQAAPSAAFFKPENLLPFFTTSAAMPQPSWLSAPINVMVTLISGHAFAVNAAFVVIMGVIGIGMIANRPRTWVAYLAFFWLLFSWWTSMDFGIMGGLGTDPNTPPVVALLMAATWLMNPGVTSRKHESPA